MSPLRTLLSTVVATAVSLGGPAPANPNDVPCVPCAPGEAAEGGTVRSLPVLSVSLAVGAPGASRSGRVLAAPGWYVRSHKCR